MITKIAIMAGEIWLELDRSEGISLENMLGRLEGPERSKDFLLMALGWLIYEGHVKCVAAQGGGQLFLVSSKVKEGLKNEKSDQNRFIAFSA